VANVFAERLATAELDQGAPSVPRAADTWIGCLARVRKGGHETVQVATLLRALVRTAQTRPREFAMELDIDPGSGFEHFLDECTVGS